MNMTKGTTKHGFGLMVVFGDGGGLVVLIVLLEIKSKTFQNYRNKK